MAAPYRAGSAMMPWICDSPEKRRSGKTKPTTATTAPAARTHSTIRSPKTRSMTVPTV